MQEFVYQIAGESTREFRRMIENRFPRRQATKQTSWRGCEPHQFVRTAQKAPPMQGYEILSNILAPQFQGRQFCFGLDALMVVEVDEIVY